MRALCVTVEHRHLILGGNAARQWHCW